MYITGTKYNYLNRLHQLPANTGDMVNFRTEANSYIYSGIQQRHITKKINREIGSNYFNFTANASYLTGIYVTGVL